MRNLKPIFTALLILFATHFVGCVSVKIGAQPGIKSEEASFQPPEGRFAEVSPGELDKVWQDEKTGGAISYLSECHNPTDPTLENIFKGIIAEIDKPVELEKSEVDYNDRRALHAMVEGNVDGVVTRFQLMIFKKNHCTYILTYAATAEAFGKNQRTFTKFVKGFTVK